VGCKDDSNGLSSNVGRDSALHGLLGHQSDRPSCSAVRRGPAHHGDDRRLLRAIEPPLWFPARLVRQCGLKSSRDVALPDARRLPWKRPRCLRARTHRNSPVEQLEDPNTSPRPGRQLALALHGRELRAVLWFQRQAGETFRGFHSLLRSEVDPHIKAQRDQQASVEGLDRQTVRWQPSVV
jgi:hypothetical protein